MATAKPLTKSQWMIASETSTQTHMVQGGVRLPSVSLTNTHRNMTHMTDTLTPLQEGLLNTLHDIKGWERINDFVVRNFMDTDTRKRVLTALNATPMDADHIDWRGVVDPYIRKFL